MSKYLSVFENILFGAVIFLLAFIPLYPKFPLLNIKGTFVAVRIEDILIALVLLVWFVYLLLSRKLKELYKDRINQALLLFFFAGALSVFGAIYLMHSVVPHLSVLHYLRRIELMLLLPVVYTVVKTKKQIGFSVAVLFLTTLIVNIYAIGQRYLDWPVISTGNSEFAKGLILHLTPGARVNSTFAGHYDLAVYLVMVLVVLAAVFFGNKKLLHRFWSLFLGAFSFLILVMTAARLSFIAVLVGVTLSLLLTGRKIFIILIFGLAVAALVYPSQLRDRLISAFTINIQDEGQRYEAKNDKQQLRSQLNIPTLSTGDASSSGWVDQGTASGKISSDITPGEPVDTTELGVYRSFGIRFDQEWPRALRAFQKNILIGTGYSSIGLATDNDYLRMLGEVGLIGSFAFMFLLIEIGKRIWKVYWHSRGFLRYFSAGIFSMMIAFLLNALFIDVFEASKIATLFWMLCGLGLAAEKLQQN